MKLLNKTKKIIKFIDTTRRETRCITYAGLLLSCFCLFLVLMLTITSGELSVHTYKTHLLIKELMATGWLVILISIFGAALFEDMASR